MDNEYRSMITFASPATDPTHQPLYRFIATAQGSQCANAVMPPSTPMANYDGELLMFRLWAFPLPVVIQVKYWFYLNVNGTGNAGSLISHTQVQRRIKIWGIGFGWKTLMEKNRYTPANSTAWDGVPGSTQSVTGRSGGSLGSSGGGFDGVSGKWYLNIFAKLRYGININVPQDLFSFVSTTSALDAPTGTDPNTQKYIFPIAGTTASATNKFIAQESFGVTSGGITSTYYNQNHTDFTARNAHWIFNEMQSVTNNTENCTTECTSNSLTITGNNNLCTSEVYSIDGIPSSATVTWSANPINAVSFTPISNGQSVTVTRIANGIDATIIATISCNTVVNKSIHLGAYTDYQVHIDGYTMVPLNFVGRFSVDMGQYPNLSNLVWSWPSGWTSMSPSTGSSSILLRSPSANPYTGGINLSFSACGVNNIQASHWVAWGYGGPNFKISPNPATDFIKIEQIDSSTNKVIDQITIQKIEIIDKMGSVVYRKDLVKGTPNGILIPVDKFRTDVYTIRVYDGIEWKSNKMIIRH